MYLDIHSQLKFSTSGIFIILIFIQTLETEEHMGQSPMIMKKKKKRSAYFADSICLAL